MKRTHGYSKKGERCYGTQDWGAKGRTNAIGALIGKTLLTVMLITANVDTNVFTSWVQQDLLPKLPENSVIVMDNAAFHKGKDMQNMITESGHILLYLPTYSPDLNPIEKKWAQAKKLRRSLQCNIDQLFKSYLL
jgi:transposase